MSAGGFPLGFTSRLGHEPPERLRTLSFDVRRYLMVREGPAQPAPSPKEPYPAEKARGGEIILNTPGRRAIFIAGLLGAVVLAIVLGLVAGI